MTTFFALQNMVFLLIPLGLIVGAVLAATGWDRYRRTQPPSANLQATTEVFVDPDTGRRMRVWFDPTTGERQYVEDGPPPPAYGA